jgi:hypothetical protein
MNMCIKRGQKSLIAAIVFGLTGAICSYGAVAQTNQRLFKVVTLLSSQDRQPYNMTTGYAGNGINYMLPRDLTWNLVIGNELPIQFNVADMMGRAAAAWIQGYARQNNAVRIGPTINVLTANFVVQAGLPFQGFTGFTGAEPALAVTYPPEGLWEAQAVGQRPLAAGIYLNPNGLPVTEDDYNLIKNFFDESYTREKIAEIIMLVTFIHEIGHALGLAHPEEGPSIRDPRFYRAVNFERFDFRRGFNTAPIMIREARVYFEELFRFLGRRIREEDIIVSDPEVEVLIAIANESCVAGPRQETKPAAAGCHYIRTSPAGKSSIGSSTLIFSE